MAATEISFIPQFDELDQQIEDEEFQTDIQADVQAEEGGGIAEALGLAEIGSDIGTGGGGGAGIFGRIAGALSSTVILLGAIVGALALLEPIQQAVGFIVRQFELLVVPLVAALLPVLELLQDLAVSVIRAFRNPQQFFSGLFNGIKNALAPFVNAVIGGLNRIPGVDIQPVTTGQGQASQAGFRDTGEQAGTAGVAQDFISENLLQLTPATVGSAVTNYLLSDDAALEKLKNQASGSGGSNP